MPESSKPIEKPRTLNSTGNTHFILSKHVEKNNDPNTDKKTLKNKIK